MKLRLTSILVWFICGTLLYSSEIKIDVELDSIKNHLVFKFVNVGDLPFSIAQGDLPSCEGASMDVYALREGGVLLPCYASMGHPVWNSICVGPGESVSDYVDLNYIFPDLARIDSGYVFICYYYRLPEDIKSNTISVSGSFFIEYKDGSVKKVKGS